MLLSALATLVATATAQGEPCANVCCNPYASPAQFCPGGIACQACGGAGACECPSAPAPSPPPGPASLKRLTVVNGCGDASLWIAHTTIDKVGPDAQDVEIAPGGQFTFQTSANGGGLVATRYWPKMGCDSSGNNCDIGDSGGPGEGCVIRIPGKDDNYTQCAPPVDTKFEATFAPPDAPSRDTVDMSLVDGYTLPFKLEVAEGSCTRQGQTFESMDCSGLTLGNCPTTETLNNKVRDLRAVDPKTGKLAGCNSPCQKLVDDKWNETTPTYPGSALAGPYCCQGDFGTPDTCAAAGILDTQYMKAVKKQCPQAYGYPYDDKIATIVCTTTTKYTVTFYCPSEAASEMVL